MARRREDLTDKQRRFVDEYLIDLNGAAAYRRAGYKARTDHVASVAAAKLLANAGIAAAVAAAQEARAKRTAITQDLVLAGLYAEATRDGEGSSHGARVSAWGLLGKHLGMFTERHEHSGPGGAPVRHEHALDARLDRFAAAFEAEADRLGQGDTRDAGVTS